jgi:arylsulfatase A
MPPNIALIVTDDLGYGDLGCYGHPLIQTPTIDRLAAEGARFTDFYSPSPVCSPARAGLLTARIPSRIGIWDWIPPGRGVYLPTEESTVATLLREDGFQTCLFGKWHLNGGLGLDQPQPDAHGFDYRFATTGFALPSHQNPANFYRNGVGTGPLEGYACQLLVSDAIRWLDERRDPGRPFFHFISTHEPHEVIASPPEVVAQYPGVTNPNEALYLANVTNLDLALGRYLDALDARGLTESTVVVFMSDNGPEILDRHPQASRSYGSAGPLRGRKLQLWEGGIRVPGIVRWPGRVPAGTVISQPAGGIDLLPTLCEIGGVKLPKTPASLDGVSLVPALDGQPIEREIPLFWHYYQAWRGPRAALRIGDWKLVGFWDGPDLLHPDSSTLRPGDLDLIRTSRLVSFELYNLERDVAETTDLSSEEPVRLREMTEIMKRMHREVQQQGRAWPETSLHRW